MASWYVIRNANVDDVDDLMRLIVGLGENEKVRNITMTKEILLEDAFGKGPSVKFYVCDFFQRSTGQPDQAATEDAMPNRTLVGFASFNKLHDILRGRSAYLTGLFVQESHRDKGIGAALLKVVAKDCLAAGLKNLAWDVLADNQRAKRFYSNIGVTNMTETAQFEYCKFLTPDMRKFAADEAVGRGAKVEIKIEPQE